jgi:transglutaminase-like putative cysteine protease
MRTGAKGKPKARDLPIELLMMLLMSTCMVYPFVAALELGQSVFSILWINLACIGVWTVALYSNRNLLLASVLLGVAACAFSLLYLMHNANGDYSPFHYRVSDFLYWAEMYLKGYRTVNAAFSNIFVLLFSTFVCFAVSLFTVRRFSLAAVGLCGAACFVSLFIIGHKINMPSLFGYILATILYFLLHSYKLNTKEAASEKALPLSGFMASALPLAALVLGLTILLSGIVEINPSWMKETRDKLIKKSEPVNNAISKNTGTLVINSNELGGNLFLNDDVVLVVASPIGNVYLRALSKDKYTGHSWEQSDTNSSVFDKDSPAPEDTQELADMAPMLAGNYSMFNRLFPSYEMTVDYAGMDPGIVYAPLKLSSLNVPSGAILVGSDEVMLSQNADSGLSYSLRFYQPQYGSEEFAELARKSDQFFYQELVNAGGNKAQFASHYTGIGGKLESYLQLPDELPARVRELALDITQNASTEYDKTMAIEHYLSSHYSYTLTPGSVDKDEDFVSQFLFDNKQGYCTYYASAMAVLLRCVGIPSRYVEGYVLPDRDPASGLFKVTKRQGHAWVEAYFQGLGWIQFEPTASFSNTTAPDATAKPTDTPKPSSALPSHSSGPAYTEPAAETSAGRAKTSPLPPLLLTVAALLALLFYLLHRVNANMKRMSPKDAAVLLFGQYLKLLSLQGVMMQGGETSKVFAVRVDELYCLSDSAFSKSAEIFQLARYSEHEISDEQKSVMLAFRQSLLAASRRKLGIARYLFFKLLWSI